MRPRVKIKKLGLGARLMRWLDGGALAAGLTAADVHEFKRARRSGNACMRTVYGRLPS